MTILHILLLYTCLIVAWFHAASTQGQFDVFRWLNEELGSIFFPMQKGWWGKKPTFSTGILQTIEHMIEHMRLIKWEYYDSLPKNLRAILFQTYTEIFFILLIFVVGLLLLTCISPRQTIGFTDKSKEDADIDEIDEAFRRRKIIEAREQLRDLEQAPVSKSDLIDSVMDLIFDCQPSASMKNFMAQAKKARDARVKEEMEEMEKLQASRAASEARVKEMIEKIQAAAAAARATSGGGGGGPRAARGVPKVTAKSLQGKTPREILEVTNNASNQDIKKAYRKKALQSHPDKGGDKALFQVYTEAYKDLMGSDTE